MLHQVIETLIGARGVAPALRQFHRRQMGGAGRRRLFRQYQPDHRQAGLPDRRSQAADIELALDAAQRRRTPGGNTAPAKRAEILNKIADRMEENLKVLAAVETIDNGKPIRETTFADILLAIDHFRYFAACMRAQEGSLSDIDHDTVAYHYHEPLGVVGPDHPVELPDPDGPGSSRRRSPPATAWC